MALSVTPCAFWIWGNCSFCSALNTEIELFWQTKQTNKLNKKLPDYLNSKKLLQCFGESNMASYGLRECVFTFLSSLGQFRFSWPRIADGGRAGGWGALNTELQYLHEFQISMFDELKKWEKKVGSSNEFLSILPIHCPGKSWHQLSFCPGSCQSCFFWTGHPHLYLVWFGTKMGLKKGLLERKVRYILPVVTGYKNQSWKRVSMLSVHKNHITAIKSGKSNFAWSWSV